MESKKINQLATELAPELSDLTIIGDPTTGISKKITLSQMASLFTGTVEEYPNLASFPLVGTADTIYIALDTNIIYRWNTGTSAYVELSPNIVTSLVFSDANGFDGTISLVGSTATLTITTALTQGSVPFIGASGALSQDNANLFFDDTNNRLGINTNTPTTALDVFGSGIIGRLNGTSTNNAYLGFASAGSNKWSIGNVQSDHRFRIYNEATTSELVSVLQTGEFGIGIANPLTKLHIFGGASALIANLDANTSVAKSISFRSGNSSRINLEVSGTESGSNAGADLFIRTYTDAGALLATPLTIVRSTGYSSFASNVAIGKTAGSTFIFDALKEDSTTTGIIGVAQIGRATTGTATDGIGGNIQLTAEDTAGNQRTAGYIAWKLAVASSSAPEGFLSIGSRNASDALNILDSGRIGIGTASPLTNFSVAGANGVTDTFGQAYIYTTDSQAIDKGGQITLGGLFSTSRTAFASIAGRKTNGTSGDSQGYLSFGTNSGSAIAERMRIESDGTVIIKEGNLSISRASNSNGSFQQISFPQGPYGKTAIRSYSVGTTDAGELRFYTSPPGDVVNERLRIGSLGFVANIARAANDADSATFLNTLAASSTLFGMPTTSFIINYWRGSNSVNYKLVTQGSTYFTGQHGNNPIDMDLKTNIEKYVGLIVSSADEGYYSVNPITEEIIIGKDAITISEALPKIKLTEIDQDKAVWGVVTNVKNDNYNTDGTFDYDNTTEWGDRLDSSVIRVNSLGEGAIWVTNINGNIENGDYICSSIINGYGRKQDDDILHNYSVAKATMSCNFDLDNEDKYLCEEFEFNGITYKKAFIGCTYHCG